MQKRFRLEEFAGHVIGAAAGDALAAGGAAALITQVELIPHFAGVGFVAGAIGGALGDLLGYILDDAPASPRGRVAGLTALVVSGLAAAPMLLLAFILLFESWFDITPLVRGITIFTGFMAGATGRLISTLTRRASPPGNTA
jgi:hypothetical protein